VGVFDGLLNHTFTVEKRARVGDGQGGWTIAYIAVGTVKGRIRPATGNERVVADAEERQITHVLYTRTTADIERGDRVTWGTLTVEVLGVREPSEAGHHYEIDCLERQREE
jgi:SPP1 family predicted phage head-tail adaptor